MDGFVHSLILALLVLTTFPMEAVQVELVVKNPPANARYVRDTGLIPGLRAWQPTPVFLPGKVPLTDELRRLQSIGSQRVGPG